MVGCSSRPVLFYRTFGPQAPLGAGDLTSGEPSNIDRVIVAKGASCLPPGGQMDRCVGSRRSDGTEIERTLSCFEGKNSGAAHCWQQAGSARRNLGYCRREQGNLPFRVQASVMDGQPGFTLKAAATGDRPPTSSSTRFHFGDGEALAPLSRAHRLSKTSAFGLDCPVVTGWSICVRGGGMRLWCSPR